MLLAVRSCGCLSVVALLFEFQARLHGPDVTAEPSVAFFVPVPSTEECKNDLRVKARTRTSVLD